MKVVRINCINPYDAYIARGALDDIGRLISPMLRADRIALVTDENVDGLYADKVVASLEKTYGKGCVFKFVLPAGESAKTPENYLKIINFMAESGLKRTDAAVALGGGVVGDMAGFAAATYMRGIDVVQVPTTLLAMIDSSVGGKTGVDLAAGKNLLGAFHMPKAVIIDVDTLETLARDEYLAGLGEGVKYAVIKPSLKPYFLENHADVVSFIAECISLKAEIVCRDELESGMRRLLNLGHTVGHALEKRSEYTLKHGRAVAIGIGVMTSSALRAGEISSSRANEIREMLKIAGADDNGVDLHGLERFFAMDKKADSKGVNAVVVTEDGCAIRKFSLAEFSAYIGA